MKNLITLATSMAFCVVSSQVLITKMPVAAGSEKPHESAMLELRSGDQGVLLPTAALQSVTDISTVPNPVEGTVVLNTTVYPLVPTSKPTLAVWDGSKWLFTYTKENVILDLDKVRNYVAQNRDADVVAITSFPSSSPNFSFGNGISGWNILVDTQYSNKKPSFEFDYDKAEQRMVIDAEGMATVDNSSSPGNFSYAVGIFVEDQLVSVKKFYQTATTGSCYFHKYNIRAILAQNTNSPNQILNKLAGQTYSVKIGVRALARDANDNNFTRLVFGDVAGSSCSNNLNKGTARSYVNILTIEKKHIN